MDQSKRLSFNLMIWEGVDGGTRWYVFTRMDKRIYRRIYRLVNHEIRERSWLNVRTRVRTALFWKINR